MSTLRDDTGAEVSVRPGARIVSLVPSLTEAVAMTAPGLLAGATDWCTHPADLPVARVRGTKNPDLARIIDLRPGLVLANEEENRAADIGALRAAGIPVWTTVIRSVDEALTSLRRMLTQACGASVPGWLADAERAWAQVRPARPRSAAIPIWRRPWMVVGQDTFAGDVLARLGVGNVFGGHAGRYPKVPLEEIRAAGPDLVVLPDEPYRFTASDGPECFTGLPVALVSGRHLTWYGPSMAEAPAVLAVQLAAARAAQRPGTRGSGQSAHRPPPGTR